MYTQAKVYTAVHTPSLSEMVTKAEAGFKDTAVSEVLMLTENISSFSSSASSVMETFIHCWETLDEKRKDVSIAEKSIEAGWDRT